MTTGSGAKKGDVLVLVGTKKGCFILLRATAELEPYRALTDEGRGGSETRPDDG